VTYRLDHQSNEHIAAAKVAALSFRRSDKDAMPPTLTTDHRPVQPVQPGRLGRPL